MKKLFLTWSAASLLALFYTACGDDVIHVHNDEYAIVDSLDSLDCNSGNEGEMALVKSTGVLYACTDGEWSVVNASEAVDLRCKSEPLKDSTGYKIICDGKTIGTVQNGTDGKNGADGKAGTDGKAGQKGTDGKAGQNGKEVNVDSVSKAVSKKVTDSVIDTLTQVLVDSLSCHVDSSWTDTKASLINVQISCGSGSSIIQLPTLVPNKNLTKHYKKTVMVRMSPSSSADLAVLEVDSSFEPTGKIFISTMNYSEEMPLNIYEIPNMHNEKNPIYFHVADIDVTNMMNSFAELRVKFAESNGRGKSSATEFVALVNLDDADTIVIDWISDYKAARIKTLMEKGSSFAKANRKANDEITEYFGLGKDFPIVEHYMSDSIEMNEGIVAMSVMMLQWTGNIEDYDKVYSDYRALFGKKGDFKTALNEEIYVDGYTIEYPLFFVDYFLFNEEMEPYAKFLQRALVDAYELPACNLKQNPIYVSRVKDGAFKYFRCDGKQEIWFPLFNLSRNIDDIASSIAGECDTTTKGDFVMLDSLGTQIVTECNGQFWRVSNNPGEGLCKGQSSGTYVKGDGFNGTRYFLCVDDGKGGIAADSVGPTEFAMKAQCDTSAKDTLYSIPDDEYFYRCDTKTNTFVHVYASENRDMIASYQLGNCKDSKAGEVNTIYINQEQREFVICDIIESGKGAWREALPVEVENGACDAKVMKKSKIYKIDKKEWEESINTGKAYYKCDCDAVEEEIADGETTSTKRSYRDCRWTEADDFDIKLNKACNSSIIDTTITSGKDDFSCIEAMDEDQRAYRAWKKFDANVDCPLIVRSDGEQSWETGEPCDFPCEYHGKTYYYSQKTEKWITLGKNETCKPIRSENDDEGDGSYCASANDNSLFFVKDSVHIDEVMVAFPSSSGSRTCENGETVCKNQANGFYTYEGPYAVMSENNDFFTFADGASIKGFALPEYFIVEQTRAQISYTCTRVSGVQEVCTAQNRLFIEEYGESSCEHPCEYEGEKYYYNFQHKNNDGTYGKWMTLAEMGLTECPAVEDYCDDHNSLGVSCSTYSGCFDFQTEVCQLEDGTDCDCDNDEDVENGCEEVQVSEPNYCGQSLTCSYPFLRIEATCEKESGTWQTQN